MHPRRFAGVRSEGRSADLAKLIVGRKEPVIDLRGAVFAVVPGGKCLRVELY
jgi:hypothetical protein